MTTAANDGVGKVHDRMPVISAEPWQRAPRLNVDRVEQEAQWHLCVLFAGELLAEEGEKLR